MIEERCTEGQTGFHVIDHWRYIAKLTLPEDLFDLGYQISNSNRDSVNQANTYFKADENFDLDIYFILVRFLINEDNKKVSNLKIWLLDQEQQ